MMATEQWTVADIPTQSGRLAVVTGGNSGIGFEAASALAGAGARVVLAVRREERGQVAAAEIAKAHPQALVEVMVLDLADLASVRRFTAAFLERHAALDLLINNAGVMALPYSRTADGFEMQFGTNHLGHFALTSLLLPAVLAAPAGRVVTVSSVVHWVGKIAFDNLDGSRGYNPWVAYGQSKLANLLFARQLQRRLAAAGAAALSLSCHPGYAATNLQSAGPQARGSQLGLRLNELGNRLFAQSAAMGALPTLYAATAPEARGGDYIGPQSNLGQGGYPGRASSSPRAHDATVAVRLWRVSEDLTGASYDALNQSAGG